MLDANKQAIAYVYGHADPRDAGIAKALTLDEARRIAANSAKLPALLGPKGAERSCGRRVNEATLGRVPWQLAQHGDRALKGLPTFIVCQSLKRSALLV